MASIHQQGLGQLGELRPEDVVREAGDDPEHPGRPGVTSEARTLVDVLDRPDLGGGWEEVWRSLEGLSLVDGAAVLAYLEHLGNATTAALVGYFLEQHREYLDVHEAILKAIEGLRPKGRHYLDRRAGGRLAKRWNLIVPDSIWERRWEEPGVMDS